MSCIDVCFGAISRHFCNITFTVYKQKPFVYLVTLQVVMETIMASHIIDCRYTNVEDENRNGVCIVMLVDIKPE